MSDGAAANWIERLYAEVYGIAQRALFGERQDHTFSPTALVNEAYLRLSEQRKGFRDERQFRAAVAVTMRRVLVDHARQRGRLKRGGGASLIAMLDDLEATTEGSIMQYFAMSEAIEHLSRTNERAATIADLRIFGGMSFMEIARHLQISERAVHHHWRGVRAWLGTILLD